MINKLTLKIERPDLKPVDEKLADGCPELSPEGENRLMEAQHTNKVSEENHEEPRVGPVAGLPGNPNDSHLLASMKPLFKGRGRNKDFRTNQLEEEAATMKTRSNRNAPLLCLIKSRDRLDEALGCCRRAVHLRPHDSRYAHTLAFVRQQGGDSAGAMIDQ